MNKLYNRQVFHNNSAPALNETNLNILTKAVDDLDNRVIEMYISGDIEEIKQTAATVKSDKAAMESEIAEAKEDIQEIIDAGDLIVKADVALAKQYRDEAFETTPAGYEQVTAQVTTNKNDITNLKSALTNFNLIDNGWFTVNQRGASSYNVGDGNKYTYDRWKIVSYASITNVNGVITFASTQTSGTHILAHFLDISLGIGGKTVTVSILNTDDTVSSYSGVFNNTSTFVSLGTYQGLNIYTANLGTKYALYLQKDNADVNVSFKAIKLEYGSISTLANDHAPNYADELVRCQCSTADSSDTFANQTHNFVTLEGYTQSKTYAALTWLPYPSGFNMDNTTIVAFVWKTDEDYYTIPDMGVVYPQLRSSNIAIYASGEEYTRGRQFKLTIMKI